MAIMPGIPYRRSAATGATFAKGNPVGLVLHRTEAGYDHCLRSFVAGGKGKAAHFLVGKKEGQVAQLVDTGNQAGHVGPGANALYLGIEFESIAARSGVKGQDPNVISDELTPYQVDIGRQIIDWVCRTHGIPKLGPPKSADWRKCKGRWNGVLGHANLAEGGFFSTDHGDTLVFFDFIALSVWPK